MGIEKLRVVLPEANDRLFEVNLDERVNLYHSPTPWSLFIDRMALRAPSDWCKVHTQGFRMEDNSEIRLTAINTQDGLYVLLNMESKELESLENEGFARGKIFETPASIYLLEGHIFLEEETEKAFWRGVIQLRKERRRTKN